MTKKLSGMENRGRRSKLCLIRPRKCENGEDKGKSNND